MSKERTDKKPAEAKRPTYQDALDESLQETFPASDPISPSAGNTGRRISTEKNPTDWQLQPGSAANNEHSAAAPGAREAESMPQTAVRGDAGLDDIYHELKRGVGRELVTDANVDALIQLAVERRDEQLAYLLREWRSACGEDADQQKR
jgi:hypothetical protein